VTIALGKPVTQPVELTKSDQSRLARLARDAGCKTADILRDVLRDGFDYTEYKVRAVNEGLADIAAGRTLTLDQIKSGIERRRAERGRTRRKAA
jgi:predicted transcriptional regulator